MPLPLVLAKVGLAGFKVATGIAVSYACEKVVGAATNDNPAKYACYLTPFGSGALVRAGGKATQIARIAIRRPATLLKLGAKAVRAIPKKTLLAITGVVGGLTRLVLKNPFIQAGIIVSIWGATVNTTNFVVNFDINQTDQQLLKAIEARVKGFYSLFGEAVGSSIGYLMCGAIPGSLAFAFNPGVAATVMQDLDDEVRANVYQQASQIGALTFQTLLQTELTRQFMNARRYLKRNPKHPVAQLLQSVMGKKDFKKWGEANQPSFTISENVVKKSIEKNVKDPDMRNFVENTLEGFSEACVEAGFIVAQNFDSALAANILAQRRIIGNPVDVSVILNPELPKGQKTNKK